MWNVSSLIARPILVLLAFAARFDSARLVAPSGEPQVHADGADADRVLLIGDGFSISDGVLSHDLGLAGNLARRLSALSGRGADIDIISTEALDAAQCIAALRGIDLARYDAVVLSIGSTEARYLISVNAWRNDIAVLLDYLHRQSTFTEIFVLAIAETRIRRAPARLIGSTIVRHARTLNRASAITCDSRARVTLIGNEDPTADSAAGPATRSALEEYEAWSAVIAPIMQRVLATEEEHARLTAVPDEKARQKSLDALLLLEGPDARVDRITNSTRSLFDAAGAAVTFIDRERQWVKSSVGMNPLDTERIGEFCDMTIRHATLMVVEDATVDPRFRHHPSVTGLQHVRFYAGYPIESPNGDRIGALCIVDTRARTFSRSEASLLRDLTLQVQNELWSSTPGSMSFIDPAARLQKSED